MQCQIKRIDYLIIAMHTNINVTYFLNVLNYIKVPNFKILFKLNIILWLKYWFCFYGIGEEVRKWEGGKVKGWEGEKVRISESRLPAIKRRDYYDYTDGTDLCSVTRHI